MRTTRLRVTMRDVEPRVERVIDVPAAITLDELHEALQVVLGWTDSHLHEFGTDDTTYAVPFEGVRRGARGRRTGRAHVVTVEELDLRLRLRRRVGARGARQRR